MSEPNDTSRAVAYLRRSRVDETRTGAVSYEAQEAAVRLMAGRWGFEGDRLTILVDWGRSGGSAKRRAGYQELRSLLETGAVHDVFSYDLSRLTRSLEEWVKLATLCRDRGARIHLSKEGTFDFSTASGEMLANILASVAQAVRRWASERSNETITALRARGEAIGRRPYGARQGEDIEAVKGAYTEAGSFYGAARLLNTRGLPTLKGKAWLASSVGWIIRHQAPELVAADRPGTPGPRRTARFALQRLVRCPCGRLLSPYSYMNGRKLSTVYRCPGARSIPDHSRPFSIPEHVLLAWARGEAARLTIPADAVQIREESADRRGELDARKVRVLDMFEAGHIDRDERDRRLAPVYQELEQLAAAEAATSVAAIPSIDWTWPGDRLNAVLRALWVRIDVGADMRSFSAEWTVPEWRS